MTEENNSDKKKHFRVLTIFCGIFTLFISTFSSIPISLLSPLFGIPINDITLEFITVGSVEYYTWGIIDSSVISTNFNNMVISDSIPFIFWISTLSSGFLLFMSSSYRNKPKNMKKLMAISLFLLLAELCFHLTQFFVLLYSGGTPVLGNGIYYLSSLTVLIFIAFLKVSDYYYP